MGLKRDKTVNRKGRFVIGWHSVQARPYLAIPVTKPEIDDKEYYELTDAEYRTFVENHDEALAFANKCRRREMDGRLLESLGELRGSPWPPLSDDGTPMDY